MEKKGIASARRRGTTIEVGGYLVRFSHFEWERLKRAARSLGLPVTAFIRLAINEGIARSQQTQSEKRNPCAAWRSADPAAIGSSLGR